MSKLSADPYERLLDQFKTLPLKKQKRLVARLKAVPETARELWSNTRRFYKPASGEHFLKVRVDMLQAANWDVAGWSVMEWERLPTKLRADLDEVFPVFQKLIREESKAMLKKLALD